MRKKMFSFKNFVMLFMAIGLLTSVGCGKQDSNEVDPVKKEVESLKKDFAEKSKALQAELDAAKNRLKELEGKEGVTKADIEKAKKEVVDLTVAKTAFDAFVKEQNGKNEATEKRIATLETLVGENKAALEKALKDLKNGGSDVTAQIEKLEKSIADNKAELEKMLNDYKSANDTKVEELNKKFAALEKAMNMDVVAKLLNSRLTSLVLLPDYVSDEGGALPIVSFSPLETACGSISPATQVRYVVSPSTVTESDIKTDELKFIYNDPKVMSARPGQKATAPKAKFVSLIDGVLTVDVSLNIDETWAKQANANNDKRIDQLMLQVPVANSDAVVSSDWFKVTYSAKSAAIVKTPKKVSSDGWDKYELAQSLSAAKRLELENPTVIEMAYDAELDLNTVVKAMYSDWKDLTPSNYGLEFAFDLNDERGNKIVYNIGDNNTDQQEFIKLEEGKASMKVYRENKPNRAAIGRTPIVHVMLKKADGCVARQGFIKISVVEKEIPAVDPVTFEPEGKTYDARCSVEGEDYQVVHRVGTQEMNEKFYYAVDMSKEEFHGEDGTPRYVFANVEGGVGTIEEVKDERPAGKTSYNLIYKLTEEEVWENAGKEVWKKGTYTYGGSVIEVTFKVTIVKPTVTLDVLLDNYWYNNSALEKSGVDGVHNTVVHNVATPEAESTDSSKATFSNNINSAFKSVKATNLLDAGDYKYEYVFDDQVQPIQGAYVTNEGKTLMLRDQEIATIERTADGDMLTYADTEVAKELLNKGPQYSRARIKLVVKNSCGKELDVVVNKLQDKNKFNVIFLRPINVEGVSPEHFVDGVDFGKEGSFIDIKKLVKLSDWRNFVTGTKKYDFLSEDKNVYPDNKNYYEYYGVKNVKVDLANVKTEGLTIGGRAISTVPTTVKIDQTDNGQNYKKEADAEFTYGVLTYDNNGNNLGQEFWLVLPVTVEYKWGEIVSTTVKVKVAPTKNARGAAK